MGTVGPTVRGTAGEDVCGLAATSHPGGGRREAVLRGAGADRVWGARKRTTRGRRDARQSHRPVPGSTCSAAGADNDRLFGGIAADRCTRGGRDMLTGGVGADGLWGGFGQDLLYARHGGRDLVNAGGGRDRGTFDRGRDRTISLERRLG